MKSYGFNRQRDVIVVMYSSIVFGYPFLVLQVLHCKCCVDTVTFPVTVTQQSPAAVSMDTYQTTIAPMMAKVQKHTWIFCNLHF